MATQNNKTYFQYQGNISSSDVSEAIGLPSGMGPFMGFARVDTSSTNPKMYPTLEASDTSSRKQLFSDQFSSPNISHKIGKVGPQFGLVTRSGHIYVSSLDSLPITMVNNQQDKAELMVFALYQDIEQPLENIPTLLGYWNQSSEISFYDTFYAPLIKKDTSFKVGGNLKDELNGINYTELYNKVKTALNNDTLLNNLTFIGVYGTGLNPNTGNNEDFSIVPYDSKWPYEHSWTPTTFYSMKHAIDTISNFLGSSSYNNLSEFVKSLLPSADNEEEDVTLKGVPIGTIIMWYGEEIPDGWQVCDGTNGTPDLLDRFPVGSGSEFIFQSSGGSKEVTLTESNIPEHSHKLGKQTFKWGDNANDRPFPTEGGGVGNNDYWTTSSYGYNNPTPVPTLPPYTAIKFIMRIA